MNGRVGSGRKAEEPAGSSRWSRSGAHSLRRESLRDFAAAGAAVELTSEGKMPSNGPGHREEKPSEQLEMASL
ncbi:hypothetical protein MUG91_G66n15 [Manis pentadactyla]|nr:hypothetical protein MUG91_G66n15 [Manis pentadactyla]